MDTNEIRLPVAFKIRLSGENIMPESVRASDLAELRKPMDCMFYPACEPMKELLRDIPVSLVLMRTVLLQREAESICAQCPDWEPKPYRE
jgi:hypothetical protein